MTPLKLSTWEVLDWSPRKKFLSEFLTGVAGFGEHIRRLACELVRNVLDSSEIDVLPQSHASFQGGLALYERRPDITMNVMKRDEIKEILTNDHHFVQEGFVRLLIRTQ